MQGSVALEIRLVHGEWIPETEDDPENVSIPGCRRVMQNIPTSEIEARDSSTVLQERDQGLHPLRRIAVERCEME